MAKTVNSKLVNGRLGSLITKDDLNTIYAPSIIYLSKTIHSLS